MSLPQPESGLVYVRVPHDPQDLLLNVSAWNGE